MKIDYDKITRIEIIGTRGREYVTYQANTQEKLLAKAIVETESMEPSFQDDGYTLKLFKK